MEVVTAVVEESGDVPPLSPPSSFGRFDRYSSCKTTSLLQHLRACPRGIWGIQYKLRYWSTMVEYTCTTVHVYTCV